MKAFELPKVHPKLAKFGCQARTQNDLSEQWPKVFPRLGSVFLSVGTESSVESAMLNQKCNAPSKQCQQQIPEQQCEWDHVWMQKPRVDESDRLASSRQEKEKSVRCIGNKQKRQTFLKKMTPLNLCRKIGGLFSCALCPHPLRNNGVLCLLWQKAPRFCCKPWQASGPCRGRLSDSSDDSLEKTHMGRQGGLLMMVDDCQ